MKRGRRGGGGEGGEGRGEKAVWQRFCHRVSKAASTANQDTLNGGKRWRGRQRGRGIGPIVDGRPSQQDSNRQKSHWTKKVVRNGACRDHKAPHFSGTGWALNILGEGDCSVRIVRATRSTQGELFHPLSGYHRLFRFSSPLLFFPPSSQPLEPVWVGTKRGPSHWRRHAFQTDVPGGNHSPTSKATVCV